MLAMLVCVPFAPPVAPPMREPSGAALVKLLATPDQPREPPMVARFLNAPFPQPFEPRREPTGMATVRLLESRDLPVAEPLRRIGTHRAPASPFPFALFGIEPLHRIGTDRAPAQPFPFTFFGIEPVR